MLTPVVTINDPEAHDRARLQAFANHAMGSKWCREVDVHPLGCWTAIVTMLLSIDGGLFMAGGGCGLTGSCSISRCLRGDQGWPRDSYPTPQPHREIPNHQG